MGKAWKKFVAVGDNHGALIDKDTARAVLKFCDHWKPDARIHLGDCFDFASLRAGINPDSDGVACDDLSEDLFQGFKFLEQFRPHVYLVGNHEDRLWRIATSHTQGVMRYAARDVIDRIEKQCKRMRCKLYLYHAENGVHHEANGKLAFAHGYSANQNAVKEHATHFASEGGSVIMGHLHRVEIQTGKRKGGTHGYSAGCLANFSAMDYAKNRLATAGWENAFAFGVWKGETANVWIARKCGPRWLLPTGVEEF
ncbi:MAG: hypothetical protein GKR97_10115 [Rhizobiaceae bacterium]|nr:hypothetical protein [Rhizobiaceae bacterium]